MLAGHPSASAGGRYGICMLPQQLVVLVTLAMPQSSPRSAPSKVAAGNVGDTRASGAARVAHSVITVARLHLSKHGECYASA
jgi:hypothetical protein